MWFSKRRIYLDYASATPVLPEALSAMREAERLTGNPGAIHTEGIEAKRALEEARAGIAHELGCKQREVIFTSGLTEANNLAVLGLARRIQCRGETLASTHWVVGAMEHDAVLESFSEVERLGGVITHVEPNEKGIVTPEAIARAIRGETILVSVGWANNEIGVVQPLREISRAVREINQGALIHSDAGQAPLYLSPQVHTLGVDLLSLGSNKLYGPHGMGALHVSNRVELSSLVFGGKQEHGLRAGTESVALAAGFAAAFEKVARERLSETERLRQLRERLASELARIPGLVINGDLKKTLPHMLNISIPNISSEYVTLALDHAGIAISTKSACREGEETRSHVVAALGGEEWRAQNTLRFSLGRDTRAWEIEEVVRTLEQLVATL